VLLDHLVSAKAADYAPETLPDDTLFTPLDKANAVQTLNAQVKTSSWLDQFDDEDETVLEKAQQERVADTFAALTTQDPDAKDKLLTLEMPEEVKSVVGMVTAYQWKFVEQANELRSMAVTKIAKETEHPDARIRLKALELLGKVTEVALFTDRVEVKRENMSDEELENRIKAKLERYMGIVDVVETHSVEDKTEDIEDLEDVGIEKVIKPKDAT
jgi:hypothetical protein